MLLPIPLQVFFFPHRMPPLQLQLQTLPLQLKQCGKVLCHTMWCCHCMLIIYFSALHWHSNSSPHYFHSCCCYYHCPGWLLPFILLTHFLCPACLLQISLTNTWKSLLLEMLCVNHFTFATQHIPLPFLCFSWWKYIQLSCVWHKPCFQLVKNQPFLCINHFLG